MPRGARGHPWGTLSCTVTSCLRMPSPRHGEKVPTPPLCRGGPHWVREPASLPGGSSRPLLLRQQVGEPPRRLQTARRLLLLSQPHVLKSHSTLSPWAAAGTPGGPCSRCELRPPQAWGLSPATGAGERRCSGGWPYEVTRHGGHRRLIMEGDEAPQAGVRALPPVKKAGKLPKSRARDP